jgi:aldose sugar dehydrogenase
MPQAARKIPPAAHQRRGLLSFRLLKHTRESSMRKQTLILAAVLGSLVAFVAPAQKPYVVETLATGLAHPWSLAFLPDGRLLVTERAGRLRVIEKGALNPQPVAGLPPVYVAGQGGLFDVLPAPDFARSGIIYLSFAHGDARANNTRLIRARLQDHTLTQVQVLFTAQPLRNTPVHYGGRMAWLGDGTLALTLGDGYNFREDAQRLDSHTGALVRLNADGSIPADNPFIKTPGALHEIYSYGHRNAQGIVFDAASGRLYAHEHGPKGGDELNLIQPGRNYGWPVITHGVDYSGAVISPYTEREGMEQALKVWVPSIAPGGMTLYTGKLFPAWQGDLFISALAARAVHRLKLDNGRPVAEEVLFKELDERIRDVRSGPDGALYLLTDSTDGKVLRVTPSR